MEFKKKKPYFECKDSQKQRHKNKITKKLNGVNKYLASIGAKLKSIPIERNDSKEIMPFRELRKMLSFNDFDDITIYDPEKYLLVKDNFSMSDKTYHAFRTSLDLKDLPPINIIKECRFHINSSFRIFKCETGFYVDVEQKFFNILKRIIPKLNLDNKLIRIKLSGDGTNVSKRIKLINFTFSIIDEGLKARTSKGHYTLGIFEIEKENYENVKKSLDSLLKQIEVLNELEIDGTTYSLRYYLGGDWKFMAIMLGLNSAQANQPCLWCKYHVKKFDNNVEWSMFDLNKGARSIEEALKSIQNSKIDHNGYSKYPIISFIPFSYCIIDMLHLFLRISDVLIDLLYVNMIQLDNGVLTNDLSKRPFVSKFFDFFRTTCKLRRPFYWDNTDFKLRDFTGTEKCVIFQNINIFELANEHSNIENLNFIWTEFWSIYNSVKENSITAEILKEKTSHWTIIFLNVYHASHITPYMHAFKSHLHEFIQLHGDVNAFNLEGLEKLNDLTTTHFFRSTNKKSFLKQLIEKRNRMDYLNLVCND